MYFSRSGGSYRRFLAVALITITGLQTGCSRFNRRIASNPFAQPSASATAEQTIAAVNQNASLVHSLRTENLGLIMREGRKPPIPLEGKLAFEKPRNFRLRVDAPFNKNVADLGSNNQEFWAFLSTGDQPALIHASYQEYSRSGNQLPIHPEWILDSFGLTEIDESRSTGVPGQQKGTMEIATGTSTPQGQPASRITIVDTTKMVVIEQHLEVGGKRVASARLKDHFKDATSGAMIPGSVSIDWPEERVHIKVRLRENQVTVNPPLQGNVARALWSMPRHVLAQGVRDVNLGTQTFQQPVSRSRR